MEFAQISDEQHLVRTLAGVGVAVAVIIGGVWYYTSRNSMSAVNTASVASTTTPQQATVPVETLAIAQPTTSTETVVAQKQQAAGGSIPQTLPPASFHAFSYDSALGKVINLSGTCTDAYYALLVFSANDDYRTSPAKARVNQAHVCPAGGSFSLSVNLQDFNLQSGSYYLFIADQGKTGTWYNPR